MVAHYYRHLFYRTRWRCILSDTALIPELAEVLRTVNPQKFDFVLFDACMMGCAEVYYELKDAARYCIASVLDIPAAGFPYASVMPYLYENAIKDYLGPICKDYIDYYNYNGWGTISQWIAIRWKAWRKRQV